MEYWVQYSERNHNTWKTKDTFQSLLSAKECELANLSKHSWFDWRIVKVSIRETVTVIK